MPLRAVALDDRYDLDQTRIFTSGTQALIRLCLMQKARDRAAGLNTAGYVSGYRGSPLGGLDQQFSKAGRQLAAADVLFQPGLNEDLAATAVWGTQQAEMRGEGRFDGVFALWYGKGPGVDRSGDVFRHANFAGTSKHGGVLALMGDDHTAESSTTAHQSEFHLLDAMMPILAPAGVQEILDYGLHGFALSRFAGLWVGLKCLKDTVESTASVDGAPDRVRIVTPAFDMPPGGLNIRPRDSILEQEARLHDHKRAAAVAYLRANALDRLVFSGGRTPKLGVVTVGKSYLDVRQALDSLGIDEVKANALGLRLLKIAAPWPIVPETILDFARGLDMIVVVEEKRALVEVQVREELYGKDAPTLVGKRDEEGRWLFPVKGALDPNMIAVGLGERILRYTHDEGVARRLATVRAFEERRGAQSDVATRTPYFCSGCPHNSSTVVPEGHRAYAGIGCHYMVQWMDRATEGFTQMGGEGANWIGEAPFSTRGHVFQNLGDGTYNHSGYLAVRAARAAGVNITYKILFNDAVAMTGGQRHDGALSVDAIARQMRAEGIDRIAVVTDEPGKYPPGIEWPSGISFDHRDDLEAVQRELATIKGVSVLIYDQTCAAEKRRRRKRGEFPDPDKRTIINELVCEGCGDCGVKSNCVSIQPHETEFGRKRRIDQSTCNKDFSCQNGFCPSFVTVHGATIRKVAAAAGDAADDGFGALPEPSLRPLDGSYGILVTGIGGTGVVTIGQIIGMAAHLEGKGCGVIDMAGLAQKGGAVYVHVRVAPTPDRIQAIRVPAGGADLVLGGDFVVTGSAKVMAAIDPGRTAVVVNTDETMPGDFARQADYSLPTERLKRKIQSESRGQARFVPATRLATALFGNSIATNMFLMGYAWQMGAIPLSQEALVEAIRINGEAVAMNQSAFLWGRRAAVDPDRIAALVEAKQPRTEAERLSVDLDETIARRIAVLTAYQDAAYAERYAQAVGRVRRLEAERTPGMTGLAEAVARYLFKLMAYKDEYEVARLYSGQAFRDQLAVQFGAWRSLEFHLAPPLLARRDPVTGVPRKMRFGPWMMTAFGLLARLKGLRGTPFDPFGRTEERRTERRLIAEYLALLERFARDLSPANHATAVALASLPEKIRGFGHVKERHLAAAEAERGALLAAFANGSAAAPRLAAE